MIVGLKLSSDFPLFHFNLTGSGLTEYNTSSTLFLYFCSNWFCPPTVHLLFVYSDNFRIYVVNI